MHLGSDFHRELPERALVATLDAAIVLKADALLIAGDLFDSNRVPDRLVRFLFEQVERVAMPVVVLPGNHDCYDATSVYRRASFAVRPQNLSIISRAAGQLLSLGNLKLDVWGKPVVDHHQGFRPLRGVPPRVNRRLVAIAHGYFQDDGAPDDRSSPILAGDIAATECDYIALGHWDRFADVSQGDVAAVYSGAPFTGTSLGQVVLVEIQEGAGRRVDRVGLG